MLKELFNFIEKKHPLKKK